MKADKIKQIQKELESRGYDNVQYGNTLYKGCAYFDSHTKNEEGKWVYRIFKVEVNNIKNIEIVTEEVAN